MSAEKIKTLRERTGAGIVECKKALLEAQDDIEQAIVILRKQGSAKAAKKEGRVAAEGCVVIKKSADSQSACMLEFNTETDFVARSPDFSAFVEQVSQRALTERINDLPALLALSYDQTGTHTIEQERKNLISRIGENIQIRRIAVMTCNNGMIADYLHGNRIGVLVQIDRDDPELGKDLAMQIAASNPQAILPSEVPEAIIAKEREIFAEQAKASGKPADVVEKMIAGRLNKVLAEMSLVGQPFIKNSDKTVGDLLAAAKVKVIAFVRYAVGEGIEKDTTNFADEVMAQVRGAQ